MFSYYQNKTLNLNFIPTTLIYIYSKPGILFKLIFVVVSLKIKYYKIHTLNERDNNKKIDFQLHYLQILFVQLCKAISKCYVNMLNYNPTENQFLDLMNSFFHL